MWNIWCGVRDTMVRQDVADHPKTKITNLSYDGWPPDKRPGEAHRVQDGGVPSRGLEGSTGRKKGLLPVRGEGGPIYRRLSQVRFHKFCVYVVHDIRFHQVRAL